MSEQLPPAGWYADPTDAGQQRYWDGTAWTDHVAPAAGGGPTSSGGAGATTMAAATGAPDTWTWQSVLATILCCNILGVVGVLNAGRAEAAVRAGDMASANRYAADARRWTLWAAFGWLAVVGLFVGFAAVGLLAGAPLQ